MAFDLDLSLAGRRTPRPAWVRVVLSVQGLVFILSVATIGLAAAAALGWIDACGLSFERANIGTYPCEADERRISVLFILPLAMSAWAVWKRYEQVLREEPQ